MDNDELKKLLCSRYEFVKEYIDILGADESCRDDILHETFISAYENRHQLRDKANINGWLCKIAYRNMLRCNEKNKREIAAGHDAEAGIFITYEDPDSEIVLKCLDHSVSVSELEEKIKSLGEPASQIIYLRFKLGFNLTEISGRLGINYNTVKTIERRAMIKLKGLIEKEK